MKTCLLSFLLILIFSSSVAIAQDMRCGIFGGINFQNLNGKNSSGDKLEYNLITGFHAGANAQIPIAPEIYFQPGLIFSTKGSIDKNASSELKYKLNYLELPLDIVYKGLLGKGHVFLGFGPYISYAVGGKIIIGSDKTNIEFKNTYVTGDPVNGVFKRIDAGAGIFAGYELENGVFLQLNTDLGLLKINPEIDQLSVKNTGFGLSAGYRFK